MSRVEFGADGIRGRAGEWPFVPPMMVNIGLALGQFVCRQITATGTLAHAHFNLSRNLVDLCVETGSFHQFVKRRCLVNRFCEGMQ